MDQQHDLAGRQAETFERARIDDLVDRLQFGEMVAATDRAQRGVHWPVGAVDAE